jgi:hypothetical protein
MILVLVFVVHWLPCSTHEWADEECSLRRILFRAGTVML